MREESQEMTAGIDDGDTLRHPASALAFDDRGVEQLKGSFRM